MLFRSDDAVYDYVWKRVTRFLKSEYYRKRKALEPRKHNYVRHFAYKTKTLVAGWDTWEQSSKHRDWYHDLGYLPRIEECHIAYKPGFRDPWADSEWVPGSTFVDSDTAIPLRDRLREEAMVALMPKGKIAEKNRQLVASELSSESLNEALEGIPKTGKKRPLNTTGWKF